LFSVKPGHRQSGASGRAGARVSLFPPAFMKFFAQALRNDPFAALASAATIGNRRRGLKQRSERSQQSAARDGLRARRTPLDPR